MVSVMLYSCILCVVLLVYRFVLCVNLFDSVCAKQFAICFGLIAILLLNVMAVFSVGGGALLDRPCMVFQRMCVLRL